MGETTAAPATQAGVGQPSEPAQQAPGTPSGPEYTAPSSQEELNRIIESRLARERAKIPTDYDQLKSEVEQLRNERLTADEKTLKTAQEQAALTATEAARAEYLPKLQAADVKALASGVISGDQLKSFMSVVNPAAFAGDNGEIDEAKVMGALTGMFGAPQKNQPAQRWQNAGQYSPPPPAGKPGEGGRAEAARRFGKQTNPTQ